MSTLKELARTGVILAVVGTLVFALFVSIERPALALMIGLPSLILGAAAWFALVADVGKLARWGRGRPFKRPRTVGAEGRESERGRAQG
jgi:hypothetical protein